MKNKSLSASAAALVFAALSAAAVPRPDLPSAAAAREPDLLDAYQRRVLTLELAKLQKEIVAARRAAGEAEELAPFKAALDEAKLAGDETNVAAKAKAFSDARETVLYRDNPGMPEKIKRLVEVGRLLEYDSRREKQNRASHPPRPSAVPAAPAPGPDPEPAADAAPDAADAASEAPL